MRHAVYLLFLWLLAGPSPVLLAQADCDLPPAVPSLLPNASLERFDPTQPGCRSLQPGGLPDNTNQANCLTGWQRASWGTTDAWNAFTLPGAPPLFPAALPQPLPSGTGLAGFWVGIDDAEFRLTNGDGSLVQNYREYLAACLVGGQRLVPQQDYRMTFSVGFIDVVETELGVLLGSPSPVRLAVYGIRSCDQLNFGDTYECPEAAGAAGWELIQEVSVSGADGWTAVDFTFRAAADYAGIAIGGACGDDPGQNRDSYRNYYFIDEIRLNVPQAFTQPVAGPVAVSGQTVCADEVVLTGTESPGATYQWLREGQSIGGATDRRLVLDPGPDIDGRYQLRVTTAAGCALSEEVVIQRPILFDQVADSVALCRAGDTITVAPTNFSAAARYNWSDGTTDFVLRVTDPGQYSVTISNSCEQRIENFVVVEDGRPQYRLTVDPPAPCPGDTVALSWRSDWYYPFTLWEVIGPGNTADNLTFEEGRQSSVRITAQEDSTVVVLRMYPSCGEPTFDTLVLRSERIAFTARVPTLSCDVPTDTIRLRVAAPEGVEYSWTDQTGAPVGDSSPDLVVNSPGTYRVELVDGVRCATVDSFSVAFGGSFRTGLSVNGATCGPNGSARVTPAGGTLPYRTEWFAGGSATPLAGEVDSIGGLAPAAYEVVVTDATGCSLRESFVVGATDSLTLSAQVGFADCADASVGQVTLTAAGGVGPYRYGGDGLTQSAPLFTDLTAGTYTFTVTDATGCSTAPVTATVRPPTPFSLELPPEIALPLGDSVTLPLTLTGLSFGEGTVSWSPVGGLSCGSCPNPTARPGRTTRYTATFTSLEGCAQTAAIEVRIDQRLRYFAPTAFSPNGDDNNDVFRLFFDPSVARLLHLRIFDRWGELVWENTSGNPAEGWDGTFRGKPLAPAAFVFVGELQLVDGRTEPISGAVALVR